MLRHHRLHRFVFILLGLCCAPLSFADAPLQLGIVPQLPMTEIRSNWRPVIKEVKTRSGIELELIPFASIPEFELGFLDGSLDLAYLNPYHMVMANKAHNYVPLLRDRDRTLQGILVVHKDSPYQNVQELEGQTIAFPSPLALASSLYLRALLTEQEKLSFSTNYVQTHSNVYRHVLLGTAEAGGGIRKTLAFEKENVRTNLRILYTTPEIVAHPLAVHPRVSADQRARLMETLQAMANEPAWHDNLRKIQLLYPVPSSMAEYQPIIDLHLENFANN
jgi:phosphonate transport system substrate-binding protein